MTQDWFTALESLLAIPEPLVDFLVLGTAKLLGKFKNFTLAPILVLLELLVEKFYLGVVKRVQSLPLLGFRVFVHQSR